MFFQIKYNREKLYPLQGHSILSMRTLVKVPFVGLLIRIPSLPRRHRVTLASFVQLTRTVSSRISQSDRLFALRTSRRRSCTSFETIKPIRRGDSQIRFDGIRITFLDSASPPTALFLQRRLKGFFPSLRKYGIKMYLRL